MNFALILPVGGPLMPPQQEAEIVSKRRRIAVWRMTIEMLSKIHRGHFPGRRFGTNLDRLLLLGAMVAMHGQNKIINASTLSRYIDMPRETVRRGIGDLVDLSLLARQGERYTPTQKVIAAHADAIADLIKRAAAML